jgi:hypothetical protein
VHAAPAATVAPLGNAPASTPVEPSTVTLTPPYGLGVKQSAACAIDAVSFGGTKTVLIEAQGAGEIRLTAVTVLDGFEKEMTESFVKTRASGGRALGEFPSKDAALAKARELCPAP